MNPIKQLKRKGEKRPPTSQLADSVQKFSLQLVMQPDLLSPQTIRVEQHVKKLILDLLGKDLKCVINLSYLGCLQTLGLSFTWTEDQQLYISKQVLEATIELICNKISQSSTFPLLDTLSMLKVENCTPKILKKYLNRIEGSQRYSDFFRAVVPLLGKSRRQRKHSSSTRSFLALASKTQLILSLKTKDKVINKNMLAPTVSVLQNINQLADRLDEVAINQKHFSCLLMLLKHFPMEQQLDFYLQLLKYYKHKPNICFVTMVVQNFNKRFLHVHQFVQAVLTPGQRDYAQKRVRAMLAAHCQDDINFRYSFQKERALRKQLSEATFYPTSDYEPCLRQQIPTEDSIWTLILDCFFKGYCLVLGNFRLLLQSRSGQLLLTAFGVLDSVLVQNQSMAQFNFLSYLLYNNKINVYLASQMLKKNQTLCKGINIYNNSIAAYRINLTHANFQIFRKKSKLPYLRTKAYQFQKHSQFPKLLACNQFQTTVLQYSPGNYLPIYAEDYVVWAAMNYRSAIAFQRQNEYHRKLRVWHQMSSVDIRQRLREGLCSLREKLLGWRCTPVALVDEEWDSRRVYQQCRAFLETVNSVLAD